MDTSVKSKKISLLLLTYEVLCSTMYYIKNSMENSYELRQMEIPDHKGHTGILYFAHAESKDMLRIRNLTEAERISDHCFDGKHCVSVTAETAERRVSAVRLAGFRRRAAAAQILFPDVGRQCLFTGHERRMAEFIGYHIRLEKGIHRNKERSFVIKMNATFETYLNTIDRHLRPLPASERADIIKEIKSSILEMESEQLPEAQILERLGTPKELAKAYLGDFIAKGNGFSLNRFLTVFAFYGLTGFSGMFIVPILGITAPMFLLCGAIAPAAGLVKFIGSLFGYDVPFVVAQFGTMALSPAFTFLYSVVMGAVLILLGRGAWKLLLRYIRMVSKTKEKLAA